LTYPAPPVPTIARPFHQPSLVAILAFLLILGGVVLAFVGVLAILIGAAIGAFEMLLGVITLVAGLGLWRMRG